MPVFDSKNDHSLFRKSGSESHFIMQRELALAKKEAAEIAGVKDMGDPSQFRAQPDTSLSIFFGTRGKGKTAAMVYFADFCKRRSERA